MEILREKHTSYINNISTVFVRNIIKDLPWQERLIGIKGSRGVGKTTLILQYIKLNYNLANEAMYISLDDIYFYNNNLVDEVDSFVKHGGKHLFIDEVHKYPNWSIEIKNIYDYHSDLKIVFTGSSLLEIMNSSADLSRRALMYDLQGLSFREFLNFKYNVDFPKISVAEIIEDDGVSAEISSQIKPLIHFSEYLKYGYYPFYNDNEAIYYKRINSIIQMILEVELPLLRNVEISKINKVKQLLFIISQSVPFKPNISSLSQKIGITRNTLVEYIKHLDDVNLLNTIYKNSFGVSLLQKPDKIFLENTNIIYAMSLNNTNIGNVRETFFLNQIQYENTVNYPEQGDFLVDNQYLFEIGGKNKSKKQIKGKQNSYLVIDDIEISFNDKIPLWLFGMLY